VAGIFAIRLKDEASFFTKADCTMASRLAAVAQATSGVTVLACGGYMLQYSSVELRRSSTLGPPIRERITMLVEQEARTVREAVGVFNRSEDLQDAIDELLSSGFDRTELSLLASEHAVEAKLGHRYEKVSALAEDPTVPRAAYVSTEAIGGAEGGLIGGLMYVGAAAAAGAIVGRRPHRLNPGQMGRRSPCALSARADGSWRLAIMGADLGC
jgi:hypothetical protein